MAMNTTETRKNPSIKSWAIFANSSKLRDESRLSKYIAAKNEANNTKTSVIPKRYLYSGIFFISVWNSPLNLSSGKFQNYAIIWNIKNINIWIDFVLMMLKMVPIWDASALQDWIMRQPFHTELIYNRYVGWIYLNVKKHPHQKIGFQMIKSNRNDWDREKNFYSLSQFSAVSLQKIPLVSRKHIGFDRHSVQET